MMAITTARPVLQALLQHQNGVISKDFSLCIQPSSGSGFWNLQKLLHFAVLGESLTYRKSRVMINRYSDYQADAFGQCISTLGPTESYTYSEMCLTYKGDELVPIRTWEGTTLEENQLISFASGTAGPSTSLDDLFLTGTAAQGYWAIATYVPAVPLVYKESDKENAEDDNDDDDKDDEDGNKDADDDNAASVMTPRQGFVSVLGITLGLLAGAGMLL
jgi:hypothetical protein